MHLIYKTCIKYLDFILRFCIHKIERLSIQKHFPSLRKSKIWSYLVYFDFLNFNCLYCEMAENSGEIVLKFCLLIELLSYVPVFHMFCPILYINVHFDNLFFRVRMPIRTGYANNPKMYEDLH